MLKNKQKVDNNSDKRGKVVPSPTPLQTNDFFLCAFSSKMSLCFIHKELYITGDSSVLFGVGKLAADKAPRFCNYLPFTSLPLVFPAQEQS